MVKGENTAEISDEGYAEMTRKENDVLVAKIKKFCNRGDYKKHNVLLVGQIGSGKSSVINTLLYPIAGEYLERARSGGGITTTKTLELKWYVSEKFLELKLYLSGKLS